MRSVENVNKVNFVEIIYCKSTGLREFRPVLENTYMRGRLDGVIENQAFLSTSMIFDLIVKVVQQFLDEPLGLEFIDLCESF